MARRKRLTPPAPRAGLQAEAPAGVQTGRHTGTPAASQADLDPAAPARLRAPIASDAGAAAAHAALQEVTRTLEAARAEGRLVQALPLDQVEAGYLTRDRIAVDEADMAALVQSLAARGQQTPIEVIVLAEGRYGLLSGWRRLTALGRLYAETGEARFATVLAVLRRPESAAAAYVGMVEENELRVGLSYYERARIAAKAVEQGVYPTTKAALLDLFATASRPKRSKIRAFLPLVAAFDGALRFPHALPERLGLALSQRLREEPGLADALRAALAATPPESAEAELTLLQAHLAGGAAKPPPAAPDPAPDGPEAGPAIRLTAKGGGLKLDGPGVTPAFRTALEAWLAAWRE
ncbi:MAG: ParB N-terminal domain-containing protein, partial [Pseudomonadota bacterium]